MKRFINKINTPDTGEINDWIRTNIPSLSDTSISLELNESDKSPRDFRFGRDLTTEEENALLQKYPSLRGTTDS